jgi:hypothetical protein
VGLQPGPAHSNSSSSTPAGGGLLAVVAAAAQHLHGSQQQLNVSSPRRPDTKKRKPPIYKVLLHNDNYNRREYVVKVLLKIVEGMTVDDAVNVMQVRQPYAQL